MNVVRGLVVVLLAVAIVGFVFARRSAEQSRAEGEAARAELRQLEEQRESATAAQSKRSEQELERLRAETQEIHKLRNEVTQLRGSAKESGDLRQQLQQLRAENQQLRAAAGAGTTPAAVTKSADQFPRDQWAFTGYGTPESALVSAIWAMREGNPKTYLESLSPEEQQRMAKVWQNKSEAEIAAKHQNDTAVITGMRVLDRQNLSADEVQMKVWIEGVGRLETVTMKRIGADWKFGGYVRPAGK